MPDGELKIAKEMSPLEYHMFKKLGLSNEDMEIVHDLSRNAAEKAAQSSFIIALTAPKIEMINLISVTSALMLGQSAIAIANQNAEVLAEIMNGRISGGLRPYDGFETQT